MKTLPARSPSLSLTLAGWARRLPSWLLLIATGSACLQSHTVTAAEGANDPLPSILVAPLHGDARAGLWQPAVGDGLAEMLTTELHQLGKFRVLESTTLEEIKSEIKMGEDGWIAPGEKVEKGSWNGADYMFVGKITRFASKSRRIGFGNGWGPLRVPIPVDGANVTQNEAEVAIDWRIIDTASRDVVKSGRGQGKETGTSWGFSGAIGRGFVHDQEFLDSALGKAAVKAVKDIVSALSQVNLGPGKRSLIQAGKVAAAAAREKEARDALRATSGVVAAVTSGFLVVSLGEKQGLKVGDKLDLYEVNEVKNSKGEVVLRDEKLMGAATVQSVHGDNSKAVGQGNLQPAEGWVVRVAGAGGLPAVVAK